MTQVPRSLIALTEGNTIVFHTFRWCGRIKREFWFTFQTRSIFGETRGDMSGQFDARRLPGKYHLGKHPKIWIRAAIRDGYDFSPIVLGS